MNILEVIGNSLWKNLINGKDPRIRGPEEGKKPQRDENQTKEGEWTHQILWTPWIVIRIIGDCLEDLPGDLQEGHHKEILGGPKDGLDHLTINTMRILMTSMIGTLK